MSVKFKNIGGAPRDVPGVGRCQPGEVLDVPDAMAPDLEACISVWKRVKPPSKAAAVNRKSDQGG